MTAENSAARRDSDTEQIGLMAQERNWAARGSDLHSHG
jgi:hypothetical protein